MWTPGEPVHYTTAAAYLDSLEERNSGSCRTQDVDVAPLTATYYLYMYYNSNMFLNKVELFDHNQSTV